MKQYTHAWLAFMAIKRLQTAQIVYKDKADKKKDAEYQEAAAQLVKWFHNYRDFVIKGAWYPDEVFKDNKTSHVIKYEPILNEPWQDKRRKLTEQSEMQKFSAKSPVKDCGFKINSGNCADRCEAISHSIVDTLKMQFLEEKGSPVIPSSNHLALRFFILSHYVADCHMPLHCDYRQFSEGSDLHAQIEKNWETQLLKSYSIDKNNSRFLYDPQGYPLKTSEFTPLMQRVEENITNRLFSYEWPGGKGTNAWDYISAVSQHSYLMAYTMFPVDYDMNTKVAQFKKSDLYTNLDDYSFAILSDAIDSIARVWVHCWHHFLHWSPYLKEQEKLRKYEEWEKEK